MQYQVCNHCVMDNAKDPEIIFNEQGICNYCITFQIQNKKRKSESLNLPWVYNEVREAGINNKYDCLLGLSGGVDSSLCLYYLVENGIRPLCFSVDNGWNTPESDENIMRMVEALKVPFYRFNIDLEEFKQLQSAFLASSTANVEIPTDHILMAATYQMAHENNIKYIISGGNLATEGIMPKCYGYQARDLKFIKSVFSKFTGRKLAHLPTISLLTYLTRRFLKSIRVINLLDYYEYNREEAKKLLNQKYGWKDYGEKHCENKFTMWFQNYYLPTKFGLDKRRPHYSSMINSRQMTRDDALKKFTEPLNYPDIMKGNFMELPIKSYKDYSNSEFWWNLLAKIYGYLKRQQ